MSTPHQCPVDGCDKLVPDDKLTCLPHWKRVPNDLARAVYRQYYKGPGSGEHLEACVKAVAAINASLRSVPSRPGWVGFGPDGEEV